MLDEWFEFHSSWVMAGMFTVPEGTKFPIKAHQKGTLRLRFRSGVVCRYDGVDYVIWEQILNADSKGKQVHATVYGRPYTVE